MPVSVGDAASAFPARALVIVVEKFSSSFIAAANSSKVLSKVGAPLVNAVIAAAFVAIPPRVDATSVNPGIATVPVNVGASIGALAVTEVRTVSTFA